MLQLGLHTGYLGLYINQVTQRNGILRRTHHERGGPFGLGLYLTDGAEVTHLLNHRIVSGYGVGAYHLQLQGLLLGDVLLQADAAQRADHLFHALKLGYQTLVVSGGLLHGAHHQALTLLALSQVLPQLLGDEGHEGVQLMQQGVEKADGGVVHLTGDRLTEGGLHHLQIPRGELVPEELIDRHERLAEAILAEEVGHLGSYGVLLRLEPLHGQQRRLRSGYLVAHLPAANQAEGVPYLVVEVTSLLAEALVEEDVVASGG